MDETPEERIREAQKTRRLLERLQPTHHPRPEDIAAFHELHAEHERKHGRVERAEEAMRRAERARKPG